MVSSTGCSADLRLASGLLLASLGSLAILVSSFFSATFGI